MTQRMFWCNSSNLSQEDALIAHRVSNKWNRLDESHVQIVQRRRHTEKLLRVGGEERCRIQGTVVWMCTINQLYRILQIVAWRSWLLIMAATQSKLLSSSPGKSAKSRLWLKRIIRICSGTVRPQAQMEANSGLENSYSQKSTSARKWRIYDQSNGTNDDFHTWFSAYCNR